MIQSAPALSSPETEHARELLRRLKERLKLSTDACRPPSADSIWWRGTSMLRSRRHSMTWACVLPPRPGDAWIGDLLTRGGSTSRRWLASLRCACRLPVIDRPGSPPGAEEQPGSTPGTLPVAGDAHVGWPSRCTSAPGPGGSVGIRACCGGHGSGKRRGWSAPDSAGWRARRRCHLGKGCTAGFTCRRSRSTPSHPEGRQRSPIYRSPGMFIRGPRSLVRGQVHGEGWHGCRGCSRTLPSIPPTRSGPSSCSTRSTAATRFEDVAASLSANSGKVTFEAEGDRLVKVSVELRVRTTARRRRDRRGRRSRRASTATSRSTASSGAVSMPHRLRC